jgi:ribulose-5-phosphate 4-epimerase/fuculose-1-phosphate aldolase
MSYENIKKRVYAATLHLYRAGLIRLSAGNISARIDDPSGGYYSGGSIL